MKLEFRERGRRIEPAEFLLPGRYKGKRKRGQQPVVAPCPAGCTWRSRPGNAESVERQILGHLRKCH
jgi:hypothetical protein